LVEITNSYILRYDFTTAMIDFTDSEWHQRLPKRSNERSGSGHGSDYVLTLFIGHPSARTTPPRGCDIILPKSKETLHTSDLMAVLILFASHSESYHRTLTERRFAGRLLVSTFEPSSRNISPNYLLSSAGPSSARTMVDSFWLHMIVTFPAAVQKGMILLIQPKC
jgi:hypothetical protein